jgi:plastocyanin
MKVSLTLVAALLLPVIVNAQSSVNVQVGAGGQLVYNPSNFTASNGTTVTFIFPSGTLAHSVTQGSFGNPCVYLNGSGGGGAGFDSGLQTGKQFTIQITNDQEPIWWFCKNTGHCGLGMVGAINPPTSGNTFDAYVAAAKALGSNEPAISDGGPVTGGVGAVATATPAPTSANSSNPTASNSGSTSTSTPYTESSAGHVVVDGLFAFLALAFGITLA